MDTDRHAHGEDMAVGQYQSKADGIEYQSRKIKEGSESNCEKERCSSMATVFFFIYKLFFFIREKKREKEIKKPITKTTKLRDGKMHQEKTNC